MEGEGREKEMKKKWGGEWERGWGLGGGREREK